MPSEEAFKAWFKSEAGHLGVPEVGLRVVPSIGGSKLELGLFDPAHNTISIRQDQLNNDFSAVQTARHELAHAIVFKRTAGGFKTNIYHELLYDPQNSQERATIEELGFKGGHGPSWLRVANKLHVDTKRYVDRTPTDSPKIQILKGLGLIP